METLSIIIFHECSISLKLMHKFFVLVNSVNDKRIEKLFFYLREQYIADTKQIKSKVNTCNTECSSTNLHLVDKKVIYLYL